MFTICVHNIVITKAVMLAQYLDCGWHCRFQFWCVQSDNLCHFFQETKQLRPPSVHTQNILGARDLYYNNDSFHSVEFEVYGTYMNVVCLIFIIALSVVLLFPFLYWNKTKPQWWLSWSFQVINKISERFVNRCLLSLCPGKFVLYTSTSFSERTKCTNSGWV